MSKETYVIYGSEYSPFSVKVRSYFRYKQIPHEWRPRTLKNMSEFQALAKLPLVPLVHNIATDEVLQDSTPIIEKMEERFLDRRVLPAEPTLAFLSYLLEEYADEWVNKPMFHYRWWREVDQDHVARGLAKTLNPYANAKELEAFCNQLKARMVPRLSFVGSNETTKDTIEQSLDDLLKLLETHLNGRHYLFGGKPSLADFGLFAQLYCCTQQPTSAAIVSNFANVSAWIERMLEPEELGGWDDAEKVKLTLKPLVESQISQLFLPWSNANAKALKLEQDTFSVALKGRLFKQDTVKYAGRSLAALKSRFRFCEGNDELEQFLLDTNSLQLLAIEDW
ncbi:glutathione S-transferase family protein [Sneathiella glossodoripedis]|uniref:glutathione S-transferase family protein n=1 Tax=Sneathiella glossodoripedis TaxID=418853 RepID=UPI00046F62A5|nr:glutathione S-transferase family protein [Sneathiella glossodoripedis]